MIDAILFDFDGVIRQWDEPDLWTFEAEAGVESGTVFATAFASDLHDPLTTGQLKWGEWRNETERRLVNNHGESIRPIANKFFEFEGRIDTEMVELVERLPSQLHLGLLTNNHDQFEEYLRRVGLEDRFEVVINTHRIGIAKPDSRAYLIATTQLGVAPKRCLFIDDLEVNVAGGEAAGLVCHHFQHRKGLVNCLKELGIELIDRQR
jgi:putative hydrolase of the HAD superfamily